MCPMCHIDWAGQVHGWRRVWISSRQFDAREEGVEHRDTLVGLAGGAVLAWVLMRVLWQSRGYGTKAVPASAT